MKNDRPGEALWDEWEGLNYENVLLNGTVYYTFDHVDMENDLVRRALASALQRDGVAYSLSNGFWIIDLARFTYGWSGSLEKDSEDLLVCDENGETFYGDLLENVKETTWVEF